MRRLLVGATLFLALGAMAGLAQGAKAADVVEPAEVDYSWSGFYIGAYAGAGALVTHSDITFLQAIDQKFDGDGEDGLLAGGLLGYNFQLSDRFVAGLQGDIAFPDMEASIAGSGSDFGPDFIVSASLRLGYLVTPDTLFYVIGGYSYGEFDGTANEASLIAIEHEDFDGFHIGAGMETRLTDRLTARIEYRYTEFGSGDPIDDSGGLVEGDLRPHLHTATIGLAYNLWPTPGEGVAASPAADVVEPMVDWSGLYLGVKGGAGAFVSQNEDIAFELDMGGEGFLGSLMAGLNWQAGDKFVLGLEGEVGQADMDWNFDSNIANVITAEFEAELDWFASASLRAGFLPTPETMIYVIGGYSYAEFEFSFTQDVVGLPTFDQSDRQSFDGFHIGAGIEAMLTDNITARIEYRYTDYGEEAFGIDFFPDGELKFDPATHTGMIGIAWLFNAI